MKKFNLLLVSLFFVFQLSLIPTLNSAQNTPFSSYKSIQCSPQLQHCLNKILKIPGAKALIESIQNEGSIQIIGNSTELSRKFGAFWDPDQRVIHIDISSNRSEGTIMGSIIFELHNASVNSKINRINQLAFQKQINKEDYVREMEYLEYVNSINASRIVNEGIKMGILPSDSYLPTYPTFKQHYQIQQMSGHSACFAHNYDMCQIKNKIQHKVNF